MKKILFLTLLFLVFLPSIVKAYCSDSEIIRLQKLAKNVTVSYVYNEENGTFTATLSNLKKDLIVVEIDTLKRYNLDGDLSFQNLLSGKHGYIIYSKDEECGTSELTTKYVMLPFLNPHYDSEECKGIENYSYCKKWSENLISYDIWYKKVMEYKKKIQNKETEKKQSPSTLDVLINRFKTIYGEYYYIILPTIIVILGIMIAVKNKKDSLV